jgi:hypothetical protein
MPLCGQDKWFKNSWSNIFQGLNSTNSGSPKETSIYSYYNSMTKQHCCIEMREGNEKKKKFKIKAANVTKKKSLIASKRSTLIKLQSCFCFWVRSLHAQTRLV